MVEYVETQNSVLSLLDEQVYKEIIEYLKLKERII